MNRTTGWAAAALAGATALAGAAGAQPVRIGFIGSMASDVGLSTLRGAQIAVDELNARGGVLGGRMIELVTADTGDDVFEGIRAYEQLAETERVEFIVSGSIDDVSLGWLPRMVEYQIPTLDTWTSYIGIIDMLVEDYDSHRPYFMNVATDEALATLYVDFGRDVLAGQMGWSSTVILREDTAFGEAIDGLVTHVLGPEAGIEVLDTIIYDVATIDFSPLFARAVASGADFIYIISTVNSQIVSSQYVNQRVPLPMTGVNVGAMGREYWTDTGGAGGGISTLSPVPSVGFALDPTSQDFVDRYTARFGDSRPAYPHFNGFNAYYGTLQAFAAAEEAGGFNTTTWVDAMLRQDLRLELNGEPWLRYGFWQPGEIEPRTGRTYPHNIRFDITPPYTEGAPAMVVIQWYEDGTAAVVYPPRFATGEFTVPSWIAN